MSGSGDPSVGSEAQRFREFAELFEASNDAIIGKRLDGRITSWNAAAERMYGYAPGEVVGKFDHAP
ncbi:MAG TPA: PAS domain-containing protein [Gaiellaceae bacterium]|jgi:PAS domain S-box-containing protein